ncbi:monovalent cation/H(+) antiporter subunit G [Streptomyces sp. DSM 41014]|uniref:Monovalent cation/H(+) antiporter subunit G n=1 Tax=Streptomyces hintoniae TaxID=3075521 RepID=A0ABU2UYN2_9ACTN|nr:monovalent cation/H(+) antiporter subunit G [Streptomyces sp. DSM 41014]MDT0478376.1 monovalent cation/H(+) antiporter subunit G [Streptomyces sp. DSM 41014]
MVGYLLGDVLRYVLASVVMLTVGMIIGFRPGGGVLGVLAGVALRLRTGMDLATLVLIGFFQMLTGPVASHLVARSAYRTGQVDHDELLFDELDEQLTDEKYPPPARRSDSKG